VLVPERLLDRVQDAVLREPFDGGHLPSVSLHREDAARLHGLAVDQDGACAALAGVARNVRPGEAGHLAQVVDEEEARLDVSSLRLPLIVIATDCVMDILPDRGENDGGLMLAFAEGRSSAHGHGHGESPQWRPPNQFSTWGLTWVARSNTRVAPESHSSSPPPCWRRAWLEWRFDREPGLAAPTTQASIAAEVPAAIKAAAPIQIATDASYARTNSSI